MNQIITGDALTELQKLKSESVDCVITSPPYYQLRDYGNEKQIGLEKTPDEYIEKLMDVFDQVKRVLKKKGTCFVVIADSYSGYKNGVTDSIQASDMRNANQAVKKRPVLLRKSLMGIPERFMLAMMNHGWICRNEIIWHKPNVIPSSAKDRFTIDFEKIYFFVKSRHYYFNQLKEPMVTNDISSIRGSIGVIGGPLNEGKRSGSGTRRLPIDGMRNMRSVWSISNTRNRYDHYAMFSTKIVERLIKAGCPKSGIVLDPFIGSGTVALMAMANQTNYIGIELNEKYVEIAQQRIRGANS